MRLASMIVVAVVSCASVQAAEPKLQEKSFAGATPPVVNKPHSTPSTLPCSTRPHPQEFTIAPPACDEDWARDHVSIAFRGNPSRSGDGVGNAA